MLLKSPLLRAPEGPLAGVLRTHRGRGAGRSLAALDQIEEPRGTGCEAGSRRRLVRQAAAQAAADP